MGATWRKRTASSPQKLIRVTEAVIATVLSNLAQGAANNNRGGGPGPGTR